jgi:uncharacterized protein (TIGR03086 family)
VSEVSNRYQAVADGFTTRVEGVATGGWDAQSPCSDWTAQDVVVHVITTQRRVLAMLDGAEVGEVDRSGDVPGQWLAARQAMLDALVDEVTASSAVRTASGEQPFEVLVGRLVCADVLIHTWDLARATGQDEQLDPAAVAVCGDFLFPIDESIRRPGGFAPKIEPAAGADAQTRLLNFCGRPG